MFWPWSAGLQGEGGGLAGVEEGVLERVEGVELRGELCPTLPNPVSRRGQCGALGGIEGPELRATCNAGLGMIVVVPAAAAARTVELGIERGVPAWVVGEVVEAEAIGGARYIEEGLTR